MPINRFKLNNNEKKHAARAYRTGSQSLPNTATDTLVVMNTKDYDPSFTFNTTTGKYTVIETGLYHIHSQVSMTIGATADYRSFISIFDNGVARLILGGDQTERGTPQNGDPRTMQITGNIILTIGHLIDVRAWLTGPASTVINAGIDITYLEIYRIGTLN